MQRTRKALAYALGFLAALALVYWWQIQAQHGERRQPSANVAKAESKASRRPASVRGARALLAKALWSLSGSVQNPQGAGVPQAVVCIQGAEAGHAPANCEATDGAGVFSFAQVPAGATQLVAAAAGHQSQAVPMVEPSISGPAHQVVTLRLNVGEGNLLGRVLDVSGGSVRGAVVIAHDPAQFAAPVGLSLSDSEGRFALSVPPGTLQLEVSADGYAAALLDVFAPAADVAIALVVSSTIRGRVVQRDTLQPTAGVTVRATNSDGLRAASVSVESDREGEFRIERLSAGRYSLEAVAAAWRGEPESLMLAVGSTSEPIQLAVVPATALTGIVQAGGKPCESGYVELTGPAHAAQRVAPDGRVLLLGLLPGTYQASIECVGAEQNPWLEEVHIGSEPVSRTWDLLPMQGWALEGSSGAACCRPVASIQVSILAADAEGMALTALAIGTTGTPVHGKPAGNRIVFEPLALGEYQVYLEQAPNVRKPVTLTRSGEARQVELQAPPVAEILGQVIDHEGLPIADVWVRASNPTAIADAQLLPALTDDQGEFVIRGRLAGHYALTVESDIGRAQLDAVGAGSRNILRLEAGMAQDRPATAQR